jgi:hypothetical protein
VQRLKAAPDYRWYPDTIKFADLGASGASAGPGIKPGPQSGFIVCFRVDSSPGRFCLRRES